MEQNKSLERLNNLISSCEKEKRNEKNLKLGERKKKHGLLRFQKEFLISINRLQGLFKDFNSEEYSYVLASRCNQNVFESYFSRI